MEMALPRVMSNLIENRIKVSMDTFCALSDAQHSVYRRGTLLATTAANVEQPDDDTVALVMEQGPYVGQPATICYYTDRHAATVVHVSPSGHKVTVQEDKAHRADNNGMSDQQSYTYERDSEGAVKVFYRGKRGYGARGGGIRLALGVRHSYHDYSF